jgi:hypothetical protein
MAVLAVRRRAAAFSGMRVRLPVLFFNASGASLHCVPMRQVAQFGGSYTRSTQ